jgi:hypothetical protein
MQPDNKQSHLAAFSPDPSQPHQPLSVRPSLAPLNELRTAR